MVKSFISFFFFVSLSTITDYIYLKIFIVYKSQLIIYQYIQRDECQPRWIDSNYVIVMKFIYYLLKKVGKTYNARMKCYGNEGKRKGEIDEHFIPSSRSIRQKYHIASKSEETRTRNGQRAKGEG